LLDVVAVAVTGLVTRNRWSCESLLESADGMTGILECVGSCGSFFAAETPGFGPESDETTEVAAGDATEILSKVARAGIVVDFDSKLSIVSEYDVMMKLSVVLLRTWCVCNFV
jgi:hypothetical protein